VTELQPGPGAPSLSPCSLSGLMRSGATMLYVTPSKVQGRSRLRPELSACRPNETGAKNNLLRSKARGVRYSGNNSATRTRVVTLDKGMMCVTSREKSFLTREELSHTPIRISIVARVPELSLPKSTPKAGDSTRCLGCRSPREGRLVVGHRPLPRGNGAPGPGLWSLVFGGCAFPPVSLGPAGDCPCRD